MSGRVSRMRVIATLGLLAAGVAAASTARAADPERPTLAQIQGEVTAQRFGSATVLCETGRGPDNSLEYKAICGTAYLALGDKLWASGVKTLARKRWEEAASWDSRLVDDAAFSARLAGTWAPAGEANPPDPTGPTDPTVGTPTGPTNPTGPKVAPQQPTEPKATEPKSAKHKRPLDAGPRWNLGLGLGLDLGYDGFAAMVVGWLTDEQYLVEIAVGAAYPTVDLRFRWFGLRSCLTPVVGLGLLIPFAATDRVGLGLAGYEALYELGESVHLDIGAAWTPVYGLNFFAGIAFVTPLNQDHPDTVVLFPQLAGSVSWYF